MVLVSSTRRPPSVGCPLLTLLLVQALTVYACSRRTFCHGDLCGSRSPRLAGVYVRSPARCDRRWVLYTSKVNRCADTFEAVHGYHTPEVRAAPQSKDRALLLIVEVWIPIHRDRMPFIVSPGESPVGQSSALYEPVLCLLSSQYARKVTASVCEPTILFMSLFVSISLTQFIDTVAFSLLMNNANRCWFAKGSSY